MPVTYQLDSQQGIICTRCFGQLTPEEVVDHFSVLERDPMRPPQLDVFLDLSEVETLPHTYELWPVVAAIRQVRKNVSFGTCAILVRTDALFGMMRIFEILTEGLFRSVRTFRNRDEAQTWLASNRTASERVS